MSNKDDGRKYERLMKKGFVTSVKNKRKIATILSATMVLAALCGCGAEEEVQSEQIVDVETVKPVYDSISVDSSFVGTVETGKALSIFPQISAKVMEKYYEVGDHVNAGDILFVLDDKALQIEKRNADANVKSAAATLDAQRANSAAVQAAANESVGTIATQEFERAKAIKEAERESSAARQSEYAYNQQASISFNEMERAKGERDKANDQLTNAQNFYNHLQGIKNKYIEISKKGDDEEAALKEADEYIRKQTKYKDYEDLGAALDAAKGVVDSASQEKSAQQGNYASSMSSKFEACANAEIERGKIANAEEAKALAQKMFYDYEMFTKNTILAEASARVAEGQANVAASDSQLESAKASQDLANLQLSYTCVASPISGVINEINIEKYGMASDQNAAYVITGVDNKKISFYVPENVLRNIEIGQSITIEKDKKLYKAVVTRKNDSLNPGESLFKVEAAIGGADADFISGTRLNIRTSVDKRDNVLTVPIGALYYDDGKPFLFVAENGKAIRKDVETGISNETSIQIVSGIDENANVITSWSSSLKDQTAIKVIGTAKVEAKADNTDNTDQLEIIDIGRSSAIVSANDDKNTVEEKKLEMVETTSKVNIRKLADKASEKLGTVQPGTRFEKIEETENGWTKIRYNSQEAYIKSDYIKVAN